MCVSRVINISVSFSFSLSFSFVAINRNKTKKTKKKMTQQHIHKHTHTRRVLLFSLVHRSISCIYILYYISISARNLGDAIEALISSLSKPMIKHEFSSSSFFLYNSAMISIYTQNTHALQFSCETFKSLFLFRSVFCRVTVYI